MTDHADDGRAAQVAAEEAAIARLQAETDAQAAREALAFERLKAEREERGQ